MKKNMRHSEKKIAGTCETCANYAWDDEEEYYTCDINLDEDDMYHFLTGNVRYCPYYQSGDEYRVVRHQM